jgi:hypothetical protein
MRKAEKIFGEKYVFTADKLLSKTSLETEYQTIRPSLTSALTIFFPSF